jgi:aminoglycoside phosphotransferase
MITNTASINLSPDSAVSSRDVLLDPDAVRERLSRVTGITIERCDLRRVKYRIGESLRVVYDVLADGRTHIMSARTFSDSAAVFDQAISAARPVGPMPGVIHDPDTSSVWWTVPNDRRLTNLATLLDPPARVRKATGVRWDRSTLVEYAPERSATARLSDADGTVVGYAKAYRDRDPLDLVAHYNGVADALAAIDGVRTPRAIGWARTDRIIVLEPMGGVSWFELSTTEQRDALCKVGVALAHVHGLPIDPRAQPFLRHRVDRVVHCAQLVATARPDVANIAGRLSVQLAGGPPPPEALVCLHGDVHADNMLFDGGQVHLIDFDQSGYGAAAADLAGVLASLLTAHLVGHVAADRFGAALLDGYGTVRPLPSHDELRWYTAAALLNERAIRGINRIYRPTLAVLPALLSRAEDVFAGRARFDG